jgi:hypothetical protein
MDLGNQRESSWGYCPEKQTSHGKWWVLFRVIKLLIAVTTTMTRWMGFRLPITNDYSDIWDECHCHCSHNPLHPIWPTQYTADSGCNLKPLHQWGDAMPLNPRENTLRIIWGTICEHAIFFFKIPKPSPPLSRPSLPNPPPPPSEKKLGLLGAY